MTRIVAGLVAVGLCGLTTPALATTKTHPVGLSVTYPDEWKTRIDGDSLTLQSPDEAVVILALVFEAADLETAKMMLDAQLKHIINDLKTVNPPREVMVNGLKGISATGIGTVDGSPANWEVCLFLYQKKTLMLVALADSAKYGFYVAPIAAIFQGVKVAAGAPPPTVDPDPASQQPAKGSKGTKRGKKR